MKEIKKSLAQTLAQRPDFKSYFSFPVEKYVRLFEARKGEYIQRQGDASQYLYYMFEGRNKVRMCMPNGKATIIDFQSAPSFIGEMEMFGVLEKTFEVRAMDRCLLFRLSKAECTSLLFQDNLFLKRMCSYIGSKEMLKIVLLTNQRGYPLPNRLADFILQSSFDDNFGETNVNTSEYLGISYRHLQDVLGSFIDKGYLRRVDNGYLITDKDALIALASEMQRD